MSDDLRLAAALSAYDAGCSVIPIAGDGTKKTSLTQWNPYRQKRATREQVAAWMADHTGYAIVCGPASGNLEVLDFDSAETYQAFLEAGEALGLGELLGRLRSGYEERTPDGGTHLPYRCMMTAGNTKLAKRPGPPKPEKPNELTVETLIETRGDGGYFIAAPSNGRVHPSGRAWVKRSGGFDTLPNIEPEERGQLFALARSFDEMPVESADAAPTAPRASGQGKQPGEAFREQHGTLDAFRGIVEPHGWKLTHRRGDVGYFRRPGKDDGWSATFGHAGSDYFYPFTSSTVFEAERGYNAFSVYAILNHAGDFTAAARDLGKQGYGDPLPIERPAGAPASGGVTSGASTTPATAEARPSFALTDMGNAERLRFEHGRDLRYVHQWSKWLAWDGARFAIDETGTVVEKAKASVRGIYNDAADETDEKRRAQIAKHAITSERAQRIGAMIQLTQSEPGIPITTESLDRDPWILTCKNGTLDLRTGKLRAADRGDLITKQAPVTYDAKAKCPIFLAFLDRIMRGDAELIGFIQRAIGYSLTGLTTERVIFILFGTGRNGKSTLLELLRGILGDYAMRTPTETLMVRRDAGVPNDIARLKGVRFVSASESEDGQRLAEAKIKDLTGSDTISARFMRGEFFDFLPSFKLWLATNHKPIIRGTDNAIWDRIKLVPFLERIPDHEQDKHLREKLMREAPGILAWAVRGCLDWQREGLGEPKGVRDATASYRSEMDILGAFLEECCFLGEDAHVSATAIYMAYARWCDVNGEKLPTKTMLGKRLTERGFESKQMGTDRRRSWIGLGLLTEAEPPGERVLRDGTRLNAKSDISNPSQSLVELSGKTRSNAFSTSNAFAGSEESDVDEDEGVTL